MSLMNTTRLDTKTESLQSQITANGRKGKYVLDINLIKNIKKKLMFSIYKHIYYICNMYCLSNKVF